MSTGRRACWLLSWLWLGACRNPSPITALARGPSHPIAVTARAARPLTAQLPAPPLVTSAAPRSAVPGPSAALPSFGSAPFSSAEPTLIEHASPDARWVALCRDSRDDQGQSTLQRYLIAPGLELAIDAWLGATPDGHFALVQQHGGLVLWDSATLKSVDLSALGADGRLSAESNAALRTVDFDSASQRLLYVRRKANETRIVVRSLIDGSERELDPGPGEVWRAHFDPGGVFIVLQMMTVDTNKNGRLDFPAPLLAAPRPCGDDLAHFRAWAERGDRPETVLLPLIGGAALHEPRLVMPVLDALLLRDEDGALLLARGDKKRLLEPAACKARVVHADAQRELFIVGCAQKNKTGRVSLELVTREGRKALNLELASVELDRELDASPRLVALYPGSDTVLFDADRRELILLQPGDSVVATRLSHALLRRGSDLLLYDADAHREQPLPAVVAKYPDISLAPPFVLVSPALVDLDALQLAGVISRRALALSSNGQILVADVDPDAPHWANGPLRWLNPALPPPAP